MVYVLEIKSFTLLKLDEKCCLMKIDNLLIIIRCIYLISEILFQKMPIVREYGNKINVRNECFSCLEEITVYFLSLSVEYAVSAFECCLFTSSFESESYQQIVLNKISLSVIISE